MDNYKKDNLLNTELPKIVIDKSKLYHEYPQIGFGSESSVHKYNDSIAFKTFIFFPDKSKLDRKFEKIEVLGKIYDEAACFPIGLIGYKDLKKEGYYCELVTSNNSEKIKDFDHLGFLKDSKKILEYIIKADEAIKRFHKMGFVLGDIKGDNIMIDQRGNVKFVDTDNWKYEDYEFDLEPDRIHWLRNAFHKKCSLVDNDKYVYAMLALQFFLDGTIISYGQNDRYFIELIKSLNVSKGVKEGLRLILSDSVNKPYISDVIKDINVEEGIIKKEDIYRLNKIRIYHE